MHILWIPKIVGFNLTAIATHNNVIIHIASSNNHRSIHSPTQSSSSSSSTVIRTSHCHKYYGRMMMMRRRRMLMRRRRMNWLKLLIWSERLRQCRWQCKMTAHHRANQPTSQPVHTSIHDDNWRAHILFMSTGFDAAQITQLHCPLPGVPSSSCPSLLPTWSAYQSLLSTHSGFTTGNRCIPLPTPSTPHFDVTFRTCASRGQ